MPDYPVNPPPTDQPSPQAMAAAEELLQPVSPSRSIERRLNGEITEGDNDYQLRLAKVARIIDRHFPVKEGDGIVTMAVNNPSLAHEIWAAAQLLPGEGIEDGVSRILELLFKSQAKPDAPKAMEDNHVEALKQIARLRSRNNELKIESMELAALQASHERLRVALDKGHAALKYIEGYEYRIKTETPNTYPGGAFDAVRTAIMTTSNALAAIPPEFKGGEGK